jgi:hypothetical protein
MRIVSQFVFLSHVSALVRIPLKLASMNGSTDSFLDIDDEDDQRKIAEKIDNFCRVYSVPHSYCKIVCQRVQSQITTDGSSRYENHLHSNKLSYFAICAIAKDEHLDVREWIEYHRDIGCSKFYFYDHLSSPPMLDTILDFVKQGLVEYSYVSQYPAQLETYQRCIDHNKGKHQFVAFLDIDEFIVVQDKTKSVPRVLKEYESYGGLVLNWLMFGSSGHNHRPPGGVLENYRNCAPHKDRNVKTIVNTGLTTAFSGSNVHYFFYPPPYYAVNTQKERIDGWTNPSTAAYNIMFINHYILKSREDYAMKIARGTADGGKRRTWEEFDEIDAQANLECILDDALLNRTKYQVQDAN